MSVKDIILNIFAISLIVILPHTELIPNFGYSIPLLLFVWLLLKYSKETFADIGFSFKSFNRKTILVGGLVAVLAFSFLQWFFFPTLEYFVTFEETAIGVNDFL